MRFFTTAVALFASFALALAEANNAIDIPSGQSTLDVTAGQPVTITWSNPSSGTVTIKLQQSGSNITPDSGIVLTSDTPASDKTFTFTIDPDQVNSYLTSGSSGTSTAASETSSGSSSSTASASTTESSSSSSTSSAASATTSAPNSNGGATDFKIQGSLVALVAVAVAVAVL
ncbi:hypothetical protein DV737_g3813, partial [Chaetothyriales sp. CBS 132003]